MTAQITVNNQALGIKEYNGQRVVTFRDIDRVHERPEGTARKRFNANRRHFVEGVDYYKISPSEFRTAIGCMDKRQRNDITLITESGYLMLVKSFTDKLAWEVQRALVGNYFKARTGAGHDRDLPEIEIKRWRGMKVIPRVQLAHYLSQHGMNVLFRPRQTDGYIEGVDYFLLRGDELREYKRENGQQGSLASVMLLVTVYGLGRLIGEGACTPPADLMRRMRAGEDEQEGISAAIMSASEAGLSAKAKNPDIELLKRELANAQEWAKSAEAEVIRLKARLYDFISGEAKG